MEVKQRILEISDEILNHLLEFKKSHPDFTFSLRMRDGGSKEIRLGKGQWFQGSNYIYVPLLKRGDKHRRIKTIGFGLRFNRKDGTIKENYVEVSFKAGVDDENEVNFHKELAKELKIELDHNRNGKRFFESPNNYLENLDDYITNTRALVFKLLKKYDLLNHKNYLIKENEFQESLNKIQAIKKNLGQKINTMGSTELDKYIKILLHKKQIILQGPPGTGKTYTAKKIATQLTSSITSAITLTPEIIKDSFNINQKIANASGKQDYYTINSINEDSVELQSDRSQPWKPKYKNIISTYNQLVQGETPSNVHAFEPYELAVAKHLFNKIKPSKVKTESNYTLVQFHPSYTYEDFVRGISAKSEGEHISYETENKTLALFAEEANNNLIASRKDVADFSKEEGIKELLIEFSETVQDKIDETEDYKITEAVSIIAVEEDAFRYTGKWKTSQRMKFKDLVTAILQNVNSRQDYKKLHNVSGLARQHSSYFFKVLELFKKDFDKQLKEVNNKTLSKPKLKNYVLIIDEINRANLPSVLGELIYALEYRGEAVNSMYAIDGDANITIPENLYIIGTMNTADRSVGHIDYAIKRRFAFVDMLPNAEVITNDNAKVLFNKVSELFTETYLASDFDVKDVHLGHSYFLLDEKSKLNESEQLKLKLDYEILPILNEYVKDGLLLETAKEKIIEISEFEC